jgi:uncharacterized membrane protein
VYDASLALHVVAAVIGFGATFSYPVIQLVAERQSPPALPFGITAILAISRYVAVPATLVVGATGLYQLADGPYGLGDGWAATGLALYVAVMLVSTLYLVPCYRRAERAEPLSPAYRAAMRGPAVVGPLVALAVLTTVVLMVLKP